MVGTVLTGLVQGTGGAVAPAEVNLTAVSTPSSPATTTAPVTSTPSSSVSSTSGDGLTINKVLAAAVEAKEKALLAAGGNLSDFHPPNLHEGLPPSETNGVVTPLYAVAPAPLGVAYYGESNTTGTIQATSVNTTSLVGTWTTTDPTGTAAELFDTSSGNAAGEFGAQLNTVLVNVTLKGQTSFASDPNAPSGCPSAGDYVALAGNVCPNEFWLQNYIEFSEASHSLTISGEIWNFSNPTADWSGAGAQTLEGFGSVEEEEVYQSPSSGTLTIPAGATQEEFTVDLYENYTQAPCHTDTVAGSGVPSCGTISTTEPVNELFLNYTVRNAQGQRICPTTEPTGRVCGEFDDVFFNSVGPSNPTGVPVYGPNGQIGSAYMQANGTAYDPLGLTNDFEFDYGIGSDDGATNNIVYEDGIVGVDYCPTADSTLTSGGDLGCSTYSATPAAVDYGGETGETSTGEVAYWAPQGSAYATTPGPTLLTGAATPITHLDTGPSLLIGLWNMTGSAYTGGTPYPAYEGGEPLSYANIHPANAWVGIAQDLQPDTNVPSQNYYQVAPTFGFFSYWKGSGGDPTTTELGSNLWLPAGWYTIEVLLSGYYPVVEQIDLTGPSAPFITLTPDWSAGAYTPDWAFSNGDLANLSVSPSNTVPDGAGTSVSPYLVSAPAPNIGTVSGVQIGKPGSLSWLFSNLNDYLFTVWIGAFINSTTAVTQFNPAPSFPMDYPSWQLNSLAEFDVPSVDGFQYYLLNTQNLAVIGASHIYAWDNSEAQSSIYSVIVSNGANDLIAGNTFAISNRGVDFTGGGTTDTSTINGVPVTFALPPARNTVWGNTFVPTPQTSYTGLVAYTPQDSLTLGEAYDRVYNNIFAANGTVNATANAGATDLTLWNVTCVPGYVALASGYYPGTTVCESTSYSQSLDGYTLTGSIVGSSYQGGNFWAAYGNEPNPYANVPFKARLTSVTGTAEISATTAGFAGDYAPLITTTVYDTNFAETGLPSSSTASEFEVAVTSASSYTWLNETATSSGALCSGDPCVDFYLPNGAYTYHGYSSAAYAAAPSVGSFTISGSPIGVETTFAFGPSYAATFTETGLASGTSWTESVAGQPSVTSTATTHVFELPNGDYAYQTTVPAGYTTSVSGYSGSIVVSSAAVGTSVPFYAPLTTPATPTVSAVSIDADQPLTVSGTIPTTGVPTYSWTWLESVNGASPTTASQCSVGSGAGASGGAAETCSIPGSSLAGGSTYSFALQVTDSAYIPESETSGGSATVSVASALAAPGTPTVSAAALDADQALTVTGSIPTSGTAPYVWQWLISENGGLFGDASVCSVDSGSGASSGATETCSVAGGSLAAGNDFAFELQVTDSAATPETSVSPSSATVNVATELAAPGAPTVSATALDVDQALTVTGTIPSSGTAPYSWQWLVSVDGGTFGDATQCTAGSGTGASAGATETCAIAGNELSAGHTYTFELAVTDGASSPEVTVSPSSPSVAVAFALIAPSAPSVSATALDVDQALTVTGTVPTTGTSPYSWQWLISVNGGTYLDATLCALDSGSGAAGGATVTCAIAGNTLTVGDTYAFELEVQDGATSPESATSTGSSAVTVSTTLTAPSAPTVSTTSLDSDQTLTVTGTIPTTGTSPYAWQWLVSVDGGAFGATTQCTNNGGTGAGAGATETCTILGGTLSGGATYAFELQVTDSASQGESAASGGSPTVSVASALTAASAPTASATALDVNQALTVADTIPTSGTAPYAWEWFWSVNGGSYTKATACSAATGTGASAGETVTCAIAASKLTKGDTYAFELEVTDGAAVHETRTSTASSTVTVSSALTAPSTPTVNRPALDANQALTVSAKLPKTGTAPYAWQWLISVNGGAYVDATQCAASSGTGASAGASIGCAIPANTLVPGDYYTFELEVTDHATTPETQVSAYNLETVTVASALAAPATPTVSATSLDVNQPLTVTGTIPTTGTSPYSYEWLWSVNGGAYAEATICSTDSGSGAAGGATETCSIAAGALTAGDHYNFKLEVTDSATTAETKNSAASAKVTVKSELAAPSAPTVSSTRLVVTQKLTVSAKLPSTGTASYSWQWLVSVNGGSYVDATQCAPSSGTGGAASAHVACSIVGGTLTVGDTYSFELVVTDSATTPETATSAASATVEVVNS